MEILNTYLPFFISGALFLAIVLIVVGIQIFQRRIRAKKALLQKVRDRGPSDNYSDFEFEAGPAVPEQESGVISGTLEAVGRRVAKDHTSEYTSGRLRFIKAGIRSFRAPAIFWGSKVVLAILFPFIIIALKLFVLAMLSSGLTVLLILLLAFIGYFLPDIWLKIKTGIRQENILYAFPDALDLMVVCLEAGMGLDQAINRVASEMEFSAPEISEEFKAYNYEVMAGQERTVALKNLARRVDSEDVANLVVLLVQADKFGTSVAKTMRVYSETFRTVRFRRAEEKAAKLTVKLIFPLILFIFPALFVVLMGPAAIRVYEVFMK